MLYKLGKVVSKTKNYLIFESNYSGHVIYVSNIDKFEIDKFQKIYIYKFQNDYQKSLFGFKEFKERIFFEDLISIQGIGPKTAMSIISSDWKRVMNLIADGDYESIAKIPYVGLRSSKQIIFEFQKKYKSFLNSSSAVENKNKQEVYKTLRILGFNEKQINLVSAKLKDNGDVDTMIEKAIEIISHEKQHDNIETR